MSQSEQLPSQIAPTRVFISYAQDSGEHNEAVAGLARLLVDHGIEVILDQWVAKERRYWDEWFSKEVRRCDYVLAIASERYRLAADGDAPPHDLRGSQSETRLLRNLVQDDIAEWTRRILPVLLPGHDVPEIPDFLHGRIADHYRVDPIDAIGAAELLAVLTGRRASAVDHSRSSSQSPAQRQNRRPSRARGLMRGRFVVALVLLGVLAFAYAVFGTQRGDAEPPGVSDTESDVVERDSYDLVPSGSFGTNDKDKVDLDTAHPGHGPSSLQLGPAREGGLAEIIIEEDHIHSGDNTARFVPVTEPTRDACTQSMSRDASLVRDISLDDLPIGSAFCVRTSEQNISLVQVKDLVLDEVEMTISFSTWTPP